MTLPTAKEIDPYDGPDGQVACKNFLGKSLAEAEALFRENSLYYQEDLMWMGPVAFRFYVQAAIHYIRSEAATNDSAIASCMADILEFRLEHGASELAPIANQLASLCGYFLEHYERFDLTSESFGNIRARFQALQKTFLSYPNCEEI